MGLKTGEQKGAGPTTGATHPTSGQGENDTGAEFGTSERGTRGTNRDFDETNQSDNQGHGHPREERNQSSED